MPIERMRRALDQKYVYLRRPDLERILAERASAAGVEVRYGTALAAIEERGGGVHVQFEDGGTDDFGLADRCRRRALVSARTGLRAGAPIRALSRTLCRRLPWRAE